MRVKNVSFLVATLSVVAFGVNAAVSSIAKDAENAPEEKIKAVVSTSTLAQRAGEPTILFKVANVKPMKNVEEETVACSFDVVFYNRSSLSVKTAAVKLSWLDDVIDQMLEKEKKELQSGSKSKRTSAVTTTPRTIDVDVNLPPIEGYKQVVSSVKINTNRCFLLLSDVTFAVDTCKASSEKGEVDCQGIFRFVSVDNPEYYSEFKTISYEDQVKEEFAEKQKNNSEFAELYNQSVSTLNAIVDYAKSQPSAPQVAENADEVVAEDTEITE